MFRMKKKGIIDKNIVFTGGGSAGHVVPCLPLIEELLSEGWNISYIGSVNGIEKEIISNYPIKYYAITTGKLRRYFSWQNFLDVINVLKGINEARKLIKKINPSMVFSKGGFVPLPVVIGAWFRKVPVLIHESDLTPGLANKLTFPFAKSICLTFELKDQKDNMVVTGNPIRKEILNGSKETGRELCDFNRDLPTIMFIGGGNGSMVINNLVKTNIREISSKYNIIQISGSKNIDKNSSSTREHKIYGYVDKELPHLLAFADLVVSRAGSNTISELVALHKPHILVPLSKRSSRGEQILNANYYKEKYKSIVIREEELAEGFMALLDNTTGNLLEYKQQLSNSMIPNGNEKLIEAIKYTAQGVSI